MYRREMDGNVRKWEMELETGIGLELWIALAPRKLTNIPGTKDLATDVLLASFERMQMNKLLLVDD